MSYTEITIDNFESEVLKSEKPVLIDFWAPWCGPCHAIATTIDKVAKDYGDTIKVCKLNVDNNPELAQRYHVMSIPSLLLFKEGQVEKQHIGLISKEKLISKFGF